VLYFDHNATSPLCAPARDAWLRASETVIGNPSSLHRIGKRAEKALEDARERLAAGLGCAAHELIWTSGATEAVNTVAQHFAASGAGEAWISALEHPCVLESVRRSFPGRHRLIPALPSGAIDLEWLRSGLRGAKPAFVAVMAANNETGVLQPWREALDLCREAGVPFLCDAAQWVGKLPAGGLGACDFVSGCAHKFGGPQGIGFLKCAGPVMPLLAGGPQEDGRRAGTENVAGALALVAALQAREATALAPRQQWRDHFIRELIASIPGARVLGAETDRLWNTVSALLPAPDCRTRWVVKLDKHGVAASTGSACASGKEKPSHVLAAMGLSPEESSRVVRFSSGWETTEADWADLLQVVHGVWAEMSDS
jgi:cysteine desulfurase